jgi:hypothetical protein
MSRHETLCPDCHRPFALGAAGQGLLAGAPPGACQTCRRSREERPPPIAGDSFSAYPFALSPMNPPAPTRSQRN